MRSLLEKNLVGVYNTCMSLEQNKSEHPVLKGVGIVGTFFGVVTLDPALAAAGALLWYVNRKKS
jgi:hypothetical protein